MQLGSGLSGRSTIYCPAPSSPPFRPSPHALHPTLPFNASHLYVTVEVVLIEKMPKLGGNSMKASSGINALNPGGPLLFERPSLWDGERGVQVPERSMGAWARLCGAERRCLMTHEA